MKLGYDRATLENRVLSEDDDSIVFPAIIAREIVHPYPEGYAYKPADELEKAAWTADGRWVTTEKHPDTKILIRREDVKGRVESPTFVKDLMDPKTQRPMDRGIRANIRLYKRNVPASLIEEIKNGSKNDVSIGFLYDQDNTPGEWRGQKYAFIQRNIFIDHVAAGIPLGRCPSPYCGIGADEALIGLDPEENEETIRIPAGPECEVTATITISEEEGIHALYCGGEKKIRTYLFSKAKGWAMERARAWVNRHRGDDAETLQAMDKCGLCKEINKVGLLETSKRLTIAFGEDALKVIRGEPVAPKPEPKIETDGVDEVERAKHLIALLH